MALPASAAFCVGDTTAAPSFNLALFDLSGLSAGGTDGALSNGVACYLVITGFDLPDSGQFLNRIAGPVDITAPIPEPSTDAMLALGLAAVSFAATVADRAKTAERLH